MRSFKTVFNFSHFSALPILISYLIELETSELNVKLLHSFEWNKGRKINGNSKISFLFHTGSFLISAATFFFYSMLWDVIFWIYLQD